MSIVKHVLALLALTQYCLASENIYCDKLIPGVSKIMSGVDITRMDLVPLEGSSVGGMRRPIIQKTCESGRTRTASNGVDYLIPHQVADFYTTPGGSKSSDVSVYKSYHQVKKNMAVDVGLSANMFGFAFSASTTYKKMQNSIQKLNKHLMDATTKEYSHKIYLQVPGTDGFLHPSFQKAIDNLTGKTYESNRADFENFIHEYGTHYFKWGSFGGIIRKYFETSTSYSYDKTDEQLSVQAKASFKWLINSVSASAKYDKSETDVDTKFESSTTQRIRYYGGEANLLDSKGFEYWQKTVDEDPALLKVGLAPLYKLVTNASVSDQLKTAIEQYVMKNFLEEIGRKLDIVRHTYEDSLVDNFLTRLNNLKEANMLNADDVKALNTEIEHHTEIPSWFSQDTQFCFRYSAKIKGHYQCNGRESIYPESLCALPGQFTSTYHDNTGGVPGDQGCLMQWGIQTSPGSPDWFQKTTICVKWTTDVWTPHESGEYCAPLNEFTDKFHDDSWLSSSHNTFKWKISSPDNAPLWFRKTELCLEWDAYKYQCYASAKKLCASPGQWTDVFTDNTQREYWSGCYLKWGWVLNN